MIDAYEIGIHLMLQEDVSAGLNVINRGLADVDRAIAATSADLAGLVRNAETASKATSMAVGARSVAALPLSHKPGASLDDNSQDVSPREASPASAPDPAEKAPPTAAAIGIEPVAPVKQDSNDYGDSHVQTGPGLDKQGVSASAPVRSAVSETPLSSRDADFKATDPKGATASFSETQFSPMISAVSAVPASPVQDISARLQSPHRGKTASVLPMSLTASVSRDIRSPTASGQPQRAQDRSISDLPTGRERPVAPWSGVDQPSTQSATSRSNERAAAPQAAGRGQPEATGGTVMLDGRLVGQWLSEHMGREASRPPAGTSFFDPRQTPAWNVSGAL